MNFSATGTILNQTKKKQEERVFKKDLSYIEANRIAISLAKNKLYRSKYFFYITINDKWAIIGREK